MALVGPGSRCAICGQTLAAEDSLFATWGVFFDASDPLFQFCDAPMHWACYAIWPHRQRFARAYFEMWIQWERANPYWALCYRDDDLQVTVNPMREVAEVEIVLADTGQRIRVKLAAWGAWVADERAALEGMHAFAASSLKRRLPLLRERFPDETAILAAPDWDAKRALALQLRAKDVERRRLKAAAIEERKRDVAPYNASCRQLHERAKLDGLSCPHCKNHSKDYRLIDKRPSSKASLICRTCGWSFGPEMKGAF